MDKTALVAMLARFDFVEAGAISLQTSQLGFSLLQPCADTGLVYVWVEENAGRYRIVYVGKAGKTLAARCKQHAAGFKHSATGQAHAMRLRSGLADGCAYVVYRRKSAVASVLGEAGIPMEHVEELALIQKFKPAWNWPLPSE